MGFIVPEYRHERTFVESEWIFTLEHKLVVEDNGKLPTWSLNFDNFQIFNIVQDFIQLLLSTAIIEKLVPRRRIESLLFAVPFVPDVRQYHEIIASHIIIFREEIKRTISVWRTHHWHYICHFIWESSFSFALRNIFLAPYKLSITHIGITEIWINHK